jgi:hypothetical protein
MSTQPARRSRAPLLRVLTLGLLAALLPAASEAAQSGQAPAQAPARPAPAPAAGPAVRVPVHPTSTLPAQRHLTQPASQLRTGSQTTTQQRSGEDAQQRSPAAAAIRAQDSAVPGVRSESGIQLPAGGQPLRLSDPAAPPAQPQHPLAPQAGTPEAALRMRVVIRQIAAHRSGESLEIDGRLQAIDHDLRSFAQDFNYKLYQLLDEQTVELDFTKASTLALPGVRSLEVQPTEQLKDGRLRIHLELLGPQPTRERKLHTDYSLPRGRTLLLGGYRLEPGAGGAPGGTLLLAITQAE